MIAGTSLVAVNRIGAKNDVVTTRRSNFPQTTSHLFQGEPIVRSCTVTNLAAAGIKFGLVYQSQPTRHFRLSNSASRQAGRVGGISTISMRFGMHRHLFSATQPRRKTPILAFEVSTPYSSAVLCTALCVSLNWSRVSASERMIESPISRPA